MLEPEVPCPSLHDVLRHLDGNSEFEFEKVDRSTENADHLTRAQRTELLGKLSTEYADCFDEDDRCLAQLKNEWPK